MTKLHDYLIARLANLEFIYSQGIIPGQCDSQEYADLPGRIAEIKRVIELIKERMA